MIVEQRVQAFAEKVVLAIIVHRSILSLYLPAFLLQETMIRLSPGMTIDQERGIAYIPTGSAAMNFYGGKRLGSNLYANCMLALDANTGKKLWHFQYIHHDTWDWDPSSAPVLLTVNHGGKNPLRLNLLV